MPRTLGTQLRHLVELLDGAVDRQYAEAGLADYRSRYTPVMRVLGGGDSLSITAIASAAGLTHSATSQTVASMRTAGLVEIVRGSDARQHLVQLAAAGREIMPVLAELWDRTDRAAASLDEDLPYPLARLLEEALAELSRCSFEARLGIAAKEKLTP